MSRCDGPAPGFRYSSSPELARVFAGRYPEKMASLHLIDPRMPELEAEI